MQNSYLRFTGVRTATGLSRATIWRMEQHDMFPRRRQLSANSVGWLKSEVDHWIESRNKVSLRQPGISK